MPQENQNKKVENQIPNFHCFASCLVIQLKTVSAFLFGGKTG